MFMTIWTIAVVVGVVSLGVKIWVFLSVFGKGTKGLNLWQRFRKYVDTKVLEKEVSLSKNRSDSGVEMVPQNFAE